VLRTKNHVRVSLCISHKRKTCFFPYTYFLSHTRHFASATKETYTYKRDLHLQKRPTLTLTNTRVCPFASGLFWLYIFFPYKYFFVCPFASGLFWLYISISHTTRQPLVYLTKLTCTSTPLQPHDAAASERGGGGRTLLLFNSW